MMRILSITLILFFALTQGMAAVPSNGYHISGLTFDEKSISFELETYMDLSEAQIEQETMTVPTVEGAGFTYSVGEPRLPVIRQLITVPPDGRISVRTAVVKENDFPISNPVIPAIPPVEKNGAKPVYKLNKSSYSRNSFIIDKNEIGRISRLGRIRGRNIGVLEVFPVNYNPALGVLRLYETVEVEIQFEKPVEPQRKGLSSPVFDELLNKKVLNPLEITPHQPYPVEYLIITADEFFDRIQELAKWKTEKGYNVDIYRISEVGADDEAIRRFVNEAYSSWEIAPTYLLLVGDVEQIPSHNTGRHLSDKYFVTVDGDDYIPDIIVGRFPVQTAEHIDAVIEKTLVYEQYSFPNESWLTHPVFLACGTDGDWELAEGTHRYVFTEYLHPPEFHPDSLWAHDGATTSDVIAAINSGALLVNYSGHGYSGGWANPAFNSGNIYTALANEGNYPFVMSNACQTATFGVDECFGESWIRAPEKGAVAFIGATNSTYWIEDDIYEKRFYDAFFLNGYTSLGGANFNGLLEVMLYGTSLAEYYFQVYHVLGDPSLEAWWGTADEFTASIPSVFPLGSVMFSSEISVDSILFTISKGTELLGLEFSSGGTATVHFDEVPDEPGTVTFAFTKAPEYKPLISDIPADWLARTEVMPGSLLVNTPTEVFVSVADSLGNPVPDARVYILGFGLTDSALTNDEGTATVVVNPPYVDPLNVQIFRTGVSYPIYSTFITVIGGEEFEPLCIEYSSPDVGVYGFLAIVYESRISVSTGTDSFYIQLSGDGVDSVYFSPDSTLEITLNLLTRGRVFLTLYKLGYPVVRDTVDVILPYGQPDGYVRSASDGEAVPRATVRFYPLGVDTSSFPPVMTLSTDSSGHFFSEDSIPCSEYMVCLDAFGYIPECDTIMLRWHDTQEFSLLPTERGRIAGMVLDATTDEPVSAEIFLVRDDTRELIRYTETDFITGEFDLRNTPYFLYWLHIRARGYKNLERLITLDSPENIENYYLTPNSGDILVVDNDGAWNLADNLHSDILEMGYRSDIVDYRDITDETISSYNAVIWSCGMNEEPGMKPYAEVLLEYINSGGILIVEGGEPGYYSLYEDTSALVTDSILHIYDWETDDIDGLAVNISLLDKKIFSAPNILPDTIETVPISWVDYYYMDAIRPKEETTTILSSASSASIGGLFRYSNPNWGNLPSVYYISAAYKTAFIDTTDATRIFENILYDCIGLPDRNSSAIAGRVILSDVGMGGSGVQVTVTDTADISDTTAYDGRFFVNSLTPGEHTISFRKEGYRDTTITVVLNPGKVAEISARLVRIELVRTNQILEEVCLGTPKPNPFNSAVLLTYSLPERTGAIEIYNILGEKVKSIPVNGKEGTFLWDASGFPTGIYLIQLRSAGESSKVRKVVLIK
ncbi:carboxypeptidase regulatory-like domain-containing protein [bacterium]|nr:carboxypeptidase regulatory-like domain-containing protein [bacterium]